MYSAPAGDKATVANRLGTGVVLGAVDVPKPFAAGDAALRPEPVEPLGASWATRGGGLAFPALAPGAGDGQRDALELPKPRGVPGPGEAGRAGRPDAVPTDDELARRTPADDARFAAAGLLDLATRLLLLLAPGVLERRTPGEPARAVFAA